MSEAYKDRLIRELMTKHQITDTEARAAWVCGLCAAVLDNLEAGLDYLASAAHIEDREWFSSLPLQPFETTEGKTRFGWRCGACQAYGQTWVKASTATDILGAIAHDHNTMSPACDKFADRALFEAAGVEAFAKSQRN